MQDEQTLDEIAEELLDEVSGGHGSQLDLDGGWKGQGIDPNGAA